METFLLIIFSLIAFGLGFYLICRDSSANLYKQYLLDEQRKIINDAEQLRQEALDIHHQMLQESIRLSREDYQKRRRDIMEK